jgi:hypothetical protein
MFRSRYMPCEYCGASVDRTAAQPHECARERVADFQMFALRQEIAELEQRCWAFLDTPHGRFEVWLAAQQVRGLR